MSTTVETTAAAVTKRLESARVEIAAAQAAIARSAHLVDLFVGPPLDHLNAAAESLARCQRTANLRRMDPHRGAD